MTADVLRSHVHRPVTRLSDITASNVAADMLKRQPLREEVHRLGVAPIHLGHTLLQVHGKRVFGHLKVVDAQVGLDEISVPARIFMP